MGPCNSDKIIWSYSSLGSITAKYAYKHFCKYFTLVSWGSWIWSSFIPPRKSITVWRAIYNKLPSWDKLHFHGPSVCYLCHKAEETVDHLFVTCDFSRHFWNKVLLAFNISILPHSSFGELCISSIKIHLSPQLLSLWRGMFVNVIWHIWQARNNLIFNNINPSVWQNTASLWADLKDTNRLSIGCMFNSQDDLLRLNSLHICGRPKKDPKILEVRWNTPPPGWIKCNTDGCALGAPGLASCGGIFRTSRGLVKGCFAVNMGMAYAFEAEIYAAILAIEAASVRNWNLLWLESDSSLVVNLLRNRSLLVPCHLRNRWLGGLNIINNMQFVVSHIYREGNSIADAFSKSKDYFNWSYNAPNFILHLLHRDLNGLSYFRFTN